MAFRGMLLPDPGVTKRVTKLGTVRYGLKMLKPQLTDLLCNIMHVCTSVEHRVHLGGGVGHWCIYRLSS